MGRVVARLIGARMLLLRLPSSACFLVLLLPLLPGRITVSALSQHRCFHSGWPLSDAGMHACARTLPQVKHLHGAQSKDAEWREQQQQESERW